MWVKCIMNYMQGYIEHICVAYKHRSLLTDWSLHHEASSVDNNGGFYHEKLN